MIFPTTLQKIPCTFATSTRRSSTSSASITISSRSNSKASIRNSPACCRPKSSMASWLEPRWASARRLTQMHRVRKGGLTSTSFFGVGALAAGILLVASRTQAAPTFFTARVAPVLEKNCVVCHGAEKHKSGLRLDSFENLIHGGESGEVIKPGDLKGSEL